MNKYTKIFLTYEKKINAFALRERVLFLLVTLGLIYYLWQVLIFDTLFDSKDKIAANSKLLQTEIRQLTDQMNALTESINSRAKNGLSERVQELQKEKKNYEDSLASLTQQLIPPKEMSKLLGEILARDHELTLITMENIPAEPVFKPQEANKKDNNKEQVPPPQQIYRHGLKLEFSGTYFATEHFLQALEALPWKLLWGELNYEVSTYPLANVKIVIYTLSLDKSCLGT